MLRKVLGDQILNLSATRHYSNVRKNDTFKKTVNLGNEEHLE